MLKKRLIASICVLNGRAVLSQGYKKYRPLGSLNVTAENLDRWGADEIAICAIDRSRRNLGPDLGLLSSLSKTRLTTPILYSGGIRNVDDAISAIALGADRIGIDALLFRDPQMVRQIADRIGSQAVVLFLPLKKFGREWVHFNYISGEATESFSVVQSLIDCGAVSECALVDAENEGVASGFRTEILNKDILKNVGLLAFGGISDEAKIAQTLAARKNLNGIVVGNFLSFGELKIHRMLSKPEAFGFRKSTFRNFQ